VIFPKLDLSPLFYGIPLCTYLDILGQEKATVKGRTNGSRGKSAIESPTTDRVKVKGKRPTVFYRNEGVKRISIVDELSD
jgi:hypothetical protein